MVSALLLLATTLFSPAREIDAWVPEIVEVASAPNAGAGHATNSGIGAERSAPVSLPFALAFGKEIRHFGADTSAVQMVVDQAGNTYTLTVALFGTKPWWFVTKYDASGNLVWKEGSDIRSDLEANSLAVDSLGNVAVGVTFAFSPQDYRALIYQFDSAGNAKYINNMVDPSDHVIARPTFMYYDGSNNLHVILGAGNPHTGVYSAVISPAGQPSALTLINPGNPGAIVGGPNGRVAVASSQNSTGFIKILDSAGATMFSDQQQGTYDNTTGMGSNFSYQPGFAKDGSFQIALNNLNFSGSGTTRTFTYRSYDSGAVPLWQVPNVSGLATAVTPLSSGEGVLAAGSNIVDITSTGTHWSAPIPEGITLSRDDAGGVFAAGTVSQGGQTYFQIRKFNATGNMDWSTTYLPAGATFSFVQATACENSVLHLLGVLSTSNGEKAYVAKFVQGVALSGVGLNSHATVGPTAIGGTIQLNAPAPAGGYLAYLTSSSPTTAGVPPQIIVPAGFSSVGFNCRCAAVDAAQWVTISASSHGAVGSTSILVQPSALSSVTVPASAKVGTTITGSVILASVCGNSGRLITLTSSSPSAVQVLPSTYINPAVQTASFTIKVVGGAGTNVTITATSNGVTKTGTIAVTQ